jgi:hypothetical protein
MNRIGPPLLLAVLVLAAAGCGGNTSAGSDNSGATAAAGGNVNTSPAVTTAGGSVSFKVDFKKAQQQLTGGLKQVEKGDVVGAATVLTACSDNVTTQLGTRAKSPSQQQSVSSLRAACTDASNAVAKLKSGDTAAATTLAKTALHEVEQAG